MVERKLLGRGVCQLALERLRDFRICAHSDLTVVEARNKKYGAPADVVTLVGAGGACPLAARPLALQEWRFPAHCDRTSLELVSWRICSFTTTASPRSEHVTWSHQQPLLHGWNLLCVLSGMLGLGLCWAPSMGNSVSLNMLCLESGFSRSEIPWHSTASCAFSPWRTRRIAPYMKPYKTDFVWYAAEQSTRGSGIYSP